MIDDKSGDVTIIYLCELEWKFLRLHFSNLLQFLGKHNLISKATFSDYVPPVLKHRSFHVNSMNVHAQWESTNECITEKLFENKDGYILWECLMPSARGRIQMDRKINKGFGYVERLTLTLKPWQLPIHILRWGRFVCEKQCIVWIRWQGDYEKCFIFHNGIKYWNGFINDDVVQFGDYHLELIQKYTLRDGPLIKTVFDKFSWVTKIFPSGVLDMKECKWQTWSHLFELDRPIAEGWTIHENVDCKPMMTNYLQKILYALAFTVILPLILIFWSKQTEKYILFSLPTNPLVAILLISAGTVLIISGMRDLWIFGHGLPMNAYPPPKLVTAGVYKILSHPIYFAASLLSFGISMYFQSKSGFWLISPILTLSWLALVHGFENEDLQKRFPGYVIDPLLNLPADINTKYQAKDIFSFYCLVVIPWTILYEAVIFVGTPTNSISTYLPFENHIPVIQVTELFYLLAYPFVGLIPLFLQTKQQIRSFMIASWINTGIGIFLQFVLPFVAVPRPFFANTILGEILVHERAFDGPTGAFPSFHVSWAFLAAYYYSWRFQRCKFMFYGFAILISTSCITTGMHSIIDVVAGFLLYLVCIQRDALWILTRNFFAKLANSWSACRIGNLRIMNHSVYSYISAVVGMLILCVLLGNMCVILLVSGMSLLAAGIWAQIIESSSGLSRPFGYFGCITGGIIGSVLASWLFHVPFISILSTFALASPWIQGIGRLRCIVQGCCHGRPTNEYIGILVNNPKSRVCTLSHLPNTYLHITPAYSMLSNLIIGMLLWRLWYSDISLSLITGLYLILIGISRFVEESFRGEIQTPIWYKLKSYQWMAIFCTFAGILISIIPFEDVHLVLTWNYQYLILSTMFGSVAAFALGMDFPYSTKRFSRLSDP